MPIFSKRHFGLICCFWLHFQWRVKNTIGWLNLTCVDNSLTLGNYVQRTHDFSCPNAPLSKIWLTSQVSRLRFTYQNPQISFQYYECYDLHIYTQLFNLYWKPLPQHMTSPPNKWSFLKSLKWDYCQDKPTQWSTIMKFKFNYWVFIIYSWIKKRNKCKRQLKWVCQFFLFYNGG